VFVTKEVYAQTNQRNLYLQPSTGPHTAEPIWWMGRSPCTIQLLPPHTCRCRSNHPSWHFDTDRILRRRRHPCTIFHRRNHRSKCKWIQEQDPRPIRIRPWANGMISSTARLAKRIRHAEDGDFFTRNAPWRNMLPHNLFNEIKHD